MRSTPTSIAQSVKKAKFCSVNKCEVSSTGNVTYKREFKQSFANTDNLFSKVASDAEFLRQQDHQQ